MQKQKNHSKAKGTKDPSVPRWKNLQIKCIENVVQLLCMNFNMENSHLPYDNT